jgi:hypothetical protein
MTWERQSSVGEVVGAVARPPMMAVARPLQMVIVAGYGGMGRKQWQVVVVWRWQHRAVVVSRWKQNDGEYLEAPLNGALERNLRAHPE